MRGLWTRSIRPPDSSDSDPTVPNDNDPVESAPGTVGPPTATPGDPHGVQVTGDSVAAGWPPTIVPSPWSGWPAEWDTAWSRLSELTDTAWMCIDLNASVLSTMPPYLVDAAETLQAEWLRNPDPDIYSDWQEFAKQLFWDFHLGEVFVLATARYATGYPARFHVVPGWAVNVEMDAGFRRYSIGNVDVTGDMLHIRYSSTVDDAHGHGPLEAGRTRLVAASVLARYGANLAAGGGIPASVLEHPEKLDPVQADQLKAQWVAARLSSIGEPAVLSGGVKWTATQVNPKDMALIELLQFNESRIAVLLGVPPHLVGLPSGGDSMTYANVNAIFDYHWRAGLRPKAVAVMSSLSEWALPRGTECEINVDAYIQPEPKTRAETAAIYNGIVDSQGNPVLTVEQIRTAERLNNAVTADDAGPLR